MTSNRKIVDKFLQGEKVVWKPLGEVLRRTKGTKITAGQMKELHKENAPVKIFAGGKTVAFVDYADIPSKDIQNQPSIIVKSRGFIEFEYYDQPFSHKSEMWAYHSINEQIDTKFIYYFLKQHEPHFQKLGSKMQMPQIATPDTDKFLVPIPPLHVQRKLADLFGKFTELTAELTLRKKQYTYYRDLLLDYENPKNPFSGCDVQWKTLAKVAIIGTGSRNTNEAIEDGEFPFYVRSQEPKRIDEYEFDETAIITAGDGVGVGKVFHFASGKYALHQRAYRIVMNNAQVIPKYAFHYIRMEFPIYLEKNSVSSSVTSLRKPMFEKFQIPIPPLETQAKIVEILDKFDMLVHSISEGLPREIELRQKQYEYYREKLLDFPRE
ncbi:restriction endonuclease subunit S [Kingella negevensis]|uniref:restriction endonuclease subunit S n=1 Tax=Kingella negevensis TaxID=1522312 RepID=UPI00254CEE03|nr:restriction endonuclease subunit S [Kingella negevensis]MDK4680103.1 restriction endonuclease subunit S [Kingella negevensis]MDK4682177.1 restriction endonuclease subunit S [Kingella negevensis]MDK4690374.1 restriction endonuclease subunit S [Kingella negevensis]MDK4692278.1 restriction endonuclease subunit S [Kingella negevensis]MDK4698582.1 restriction endonuclease subunit S [Kingella negevensis]